MNEFDFEWTSLPMKIIFGEGSRRRLSSLVNRQHPIFVIATDRLKNEIETLVEDLKPYEGVIHFSEVKQHVPDDLIKDALAVYRSHECQQIVAIGGGSAIGLAKAMALKTSAEIIAVPTTYSGSEMTNIWGVSVEGEGKTTGRDDAVLPKVVIYDPELTLNMPFSLAAKSALNALAHLMEGLYAHDGNPITHNNSLHGVKSIRKGLEILSADGKLTRESNQNLLLGAFLAGKSLCEVSMSLHHKAAHVLGGTFGLEHALVHSIMQAYVLEFQWPHLEESVKRDFQTAYGHEYPPQSLRELVVKLGIPSALSEIGFDASQIERAADVMMEKPYANPAPLKREALVELLTRATKGELRGIMT